TRGVLSTLLMLIDQGATHVGVATDHVIESFRNRLWPGYKSSAGMPPELLAQFPLLEEAIAAMGIVVWPMVELEADDGLASAAVLHKYRHLENIPPDGRDWDVRVGRPTGLATTLQEHWKDALLFRDLATLRIDRTLVSGPDELEWKGPTDSFAPFCQSIDGD